MASLQLVSGHYHICFRFNGNRFKQSLKTSRSDQADARRIRLKEPIRLVETGRLIVPSDVNDIASFLLTDGKFAQGKSEGSNESTPRPGQNPAQLLQKYVRQTYNNSMS